MMKLFNLQYYKMFIVYSDNFWKMEFWKYF